jgi:hypothetical protein
MNYGDLQTAFLGLLNRRDCTATQAQSFLQMSIVRIQRELRCPAMEKTTVATIALGYAGLTIPSDLLELQDLIPLTYSGGSTTTNLVRMEKCDISRANVMSLTTGIPSVYSRDGGVWVLGPSPLVGDTIKIKYYAELGALAVSTDTNVISIIASDLILYGALSFAGDFFTDKRVGGWEARYVQICEDLQEQSDEDELHGAACVQPAFAYPDDLGDTDFYPYPNNQ